MIPTSNHFQQNLFLSNYCPNTINSSQGIDENLTFNSNSISKTEYKQIGYFKVDERSDLLHCFQPQKPSKQQCLTSISSSYLREKDKMQNDQCKKVLFSNQHTAPQEAAKAGNESTPSVSPSQQVQQASQETRELKDNSSLLGQSHLTQLPKKDLFNELLTANNKNTSNRSNNFPNIRENIPNSLLPQIKIPESQNFVTIQKPSSVLLQNSTKPLQEECNNTKISNKIIQNKKQSNYGSSNSTHFTQNHSSQRQSQGIQSNLNEKSRNQNNLNANAPSSSEPTLNDINYSNYPYYNNSSYQQNYNEEEVDFSAYNDMYAGYYYPPYPLIPIDAIEVKKVEEGQSEEYLASSEEYKKFYYNQPSYGQYQHNGTFPESIQQEPSNSIAGSTQSAHQNSQNQVGQSSNIQGEQYDQSYIRGYYDSKAYYPSYYYPPINEVYHGYSKKISKKSSTSGSYHSQVGAANSKKFEQPIMYVNPLEAGFHDQYLHSYPQSIYCDPSYYCSEASYKKPEYNFHQEKESLKGGSSKDQIGSTKYRSKSGANMLKLRENLDADICDNQESSQQNNQSTSHEIRKRKRKNNDQLKVLKIEYQKGGFWGKEKILEVAQFTGLSESQVYKWCWDQKKKRLETFKKRLGNKILNGSSVGSDEQFEDMSGDGMEEESYRQTGSPEKMVKLNDESGVVALKTNISKLSNDFTISQLQEKVLSNKGRALQNITDKMLSHQNNIQQENLIPQYKQTNNKLQQNNTNKHCQITQNGNYHNQDQENIKPDQPNSSQQQQQQQQLDEISKRLHFNSAF